MPPPPGAQRHHLRFILEARAGNEEWKCASNTGLSSAMHGMRFLFAHEAVDRSGAIHPVVAFFLREDAARADARPPGLSPTLDASQLR